MGDRRMVYPYTLTAKLVQFPYKFHYKNMWAFRCWVHGVIASIPIFWSIQNLVCSPQNVAKFEELAKKDHEQHLKHLEHLR